MGAYSLFCLTENEIIFIFFYHEPHEHHELFIHILLLFVLVRVVRGRNSYFWTPQLIQGTKREEGVIG
jgi:hypothetical protein